MTLRAFLMLLWQRSQPRASCGMLWGMPRLAGLLQQLGLGARLDQGLWGTFSPAKLVALHSMHSSA